MTSHDQTAAAGACDAGYITVKEYLRLAAENGWEPRVPRGAGACGGSGGFSPQASLSSETPAPIGGRGCWAGEPARS
jgi:hypothetical protein